MPADDEGAPVPRPPRLWQQRPGPAPATTAARLRRPRRSPGPVLSVVRHGQDDRARDDGTPLTRQGAWLRVRYAAKRAKVPPGVYIEFV